jgi:hypothetical protein
MPAGQYRTRWQFAREAEPRLLTSGSLSLHRPRQAPAEEVAPGEYEPTPLFNVRGIGFDRMHFFSYTLDDEPVPDIAVLPPMQETAAIEGAIALGASGAAVRAKTQGEAFDCRGSATCSEPYQGATQ